MVCNHGQCHLLVAAGSAKVSASVNVRPKRRLRLQEFNAAPAAHFCGRTAAACSAASAAACPGAPACPHAGSADPAAAGTYWAGNGAFPASAELACCPRDGSCPPVQFRALDERLASCRTKKEKTQISLCYILLTSSTMSASHVSGCNEKLLTSSLWKKLKTATVGWFCPYRPVSDSQASA